MRLVRALGTWSVLIISFVLISSPNRSQASTQAANGEPAISALFLSDIHFEPFWDPAKAPQLAAAPVAQWNAILFAPESSDRASQFAALQKSCHAKGIDTSFPLFTASLKAMRADAADTRFVTISGDLISHDFSCKLRKALPHATEAEYQGFAAKTVAFVVDELKATFPGTPVYVSLGNNDSNCGDYQLDPNSEFLSATGEAAASSLPAAERAGVERTFAAGGYFSAALPMRNTRLLILDDLFMSDRYASCSGKPDAKPAADQIAWLREQLNEARRDHEKIWVMSHIPPGINAYSTARKMRDVCGGEPADTFLASDALASTLTEYGDVIKLVLFGHTHMDELRLLEPAAGASADHPAIAVKMASSISPVDGNNPSFTVAQIDPATATLIDYQVFAAPDPSGSSWSKEYDFAETYHEPAFTPATLTGLIAGFSADGKARTAASQSYLHNYFIGDRADELKPFWPEYVCTLEGRTPEAYRNCVCSSGAKGN
jgi:sphingomyelin phosphodiesterase acid-like 3